MKKKSLKKAYFTLVELMVVITIIGLLGGIVGIEVFKKVNLAKIATTRASVVELTKAINFYYMDSGKYPSALNDLYVKPEGVKGWKGPYLTGELKPDAWKNPFQYTTNTGGTGSKPFQIYSYGPDQAEGGDDDIYENEDDNGQNGGGGGEGVQQAPAKPEEPK